MNRIQLKLVNTMKLMLKVNAHENSTQKSIRYKNVNNNNNNHHREINIAT